MGSVCSIFLFQNVYNNKPNVQSKAIDGSIEVFRAAHSFYAFLETKERKFMELTFELFLYSYG